MTLAFKKQSDNLWDMQVTMDPADGIVVEGSVEGITFDEKGNFQQIASTGSSTEDIVLEFGGIPTQQQISLDFGGGNLGDGMTQFKAKFSTRSQPDGFGRRPSRQSASPETGRSSASQRTDRFSLSHSWRLPHSRIPKA